MNKYQTGLYGIFDAVLHFLLLWKRRLDGANDVRIFITVVVTGVDFLPLVSEKNNINKQTKQTLSLSVSLDVILCGWLGSKHHLSN